MLRIATLLILVFGLVLPGGQAMAERIGVASVVKNEVSGSAAGNNRVIKVGAGVFQNEVITTGKASSAQLLFRDETSLTIGANARLMLDRFVYDPNRKTGEVVVNVVQGAFRFVSGSAGPGSYKIKTPVASIGLRGTIVEGYVSPDGSLLLVIVEGSVIVTSSNGTSVTLGAGQYITISRDGVITGPSPWTGRTLDIESGQDFILDTDNPLGEQRDLLNDALDSRNVETTFPEAPPRSTGGGNTTINQPSDLRLKRDISYLATLESGIKVYAFKYLWEDKVRVGVMAQDLLRDPRFTHAVSRADNGFYAVNYGALGLRMTTLADWRKFGIAALRSDAAPSTLKASAPGRPFARD